MITQQQLIDGFGLNLRLVLMQTDGLSHADCLVQTDFKINSMNWVLGHLAVNRDNVLGLLGQAPLLTEARSARYQRGSEPVRQDGEDVIQLEELLEILKRGQELLSGAISRLTPEELAREIQVGEQTQTLAQRLFGFYFHDTYHTGQTDLLRQVAGKSDQVIR